MFWGKSKGWSSGDSLDHDGLQTAPEEDNVYSDDDIPSDVDMDDPYFKEEFKDNAKPSKSKMKKDKKKQHVEEEEDEETKRKKVSHCLRGTQFAQFELSATFLDIH